MKVSSVLTVAAAATVVSAQLEAIPQCALSCAITSLGSTGCAPTDIACVCKASGFIAALTPCVQSACSAADLAATIQAATGLCAQAGVQISIPVASATSAQASASSAVSSLSSYISASVSSAQSSASSVYSSLSSVASSLSTAYVSANATATTSGYVVPTGNTTVTSGMTTRIPTGTGTTTLPTASPTGNAASRNAVTGGFVAALAFAAALL